MLVLGLGFLSFFLVVVYGAGEGLVSASKQAERGRYLVHEVARCIECHSPRNASGELDRSRLLRGAPIPVKSPFPSRPWAFRAPSIVGLPGWTESAAIFFLTRGRRESGNKLRPPMPEYRIAREDAEAIVAYLKSLE